MQSKGKNIINMTKQIRSLSEKKVKCIMMSKCNLLSLSILNF